MGGVQRAAARNEVDGPNAELVPDKDGHEQARVSKNLCVKQWQVALSTTRVVCASYISLLQLSMSDEHAVRRCRRPTPSRAPISN
jgi:hypothetical protein